jgi:hypothetical protein
MENNTQTPEIKLSAAEIEMIQIKRQKEELAAQEAAAKKKIENEKSIEAKKKEIATFLLFCAERFNAVMMYFNQLEAIDLRFKITETKRTKSFECYNWIKCYNWITNEAGKDEKEIYFTEEVPYNDYEITFEGLTDIIIVEEHMVSSKSRSLYSRPTNEGFKMALKYGDNKYYKVAQTVATKLIDKSNELVKKNQYAQTKSTAKEQALVFLTNEYPEAEITHDTKWNPGHQGFNKRSSSPGYDVAFYKVKFANGMTFKFTYGMMDVKLHITYYGMEGVSDSNIGKVINALKGI